VATDAGRAFLLQTVKQTSPGLNVLVNNASIMLALDFKNHAPVTATQTRDETEIDFLAPMLLSLDFIPLLATQPESAIVNLGSVLAYVPFARTPVYCAAKAGIHSFSVSLRFQLNATSIRVVEVIPPAVDTPLMRGFKFQKIAPARVASEIVRGLAANRTEIRIGQTTMVYFLSPLAPGMAQRFLNRTPVTSDPRL
jgi:short-subunit dehydrogenase involved in D-alanine esterification of teichoic acids